MPELFDLTGRTALVTGSSRGIGAALARAFAAHGADVAIHYSSQRAAAEAVAADCGAKAVLQAELADEDAPRTLFEAACAALGRVDILVLNASIQLRTHWTTITGEQFDEQIRVNWRSSWELAELALPPMCARGWGRLLAIGSVQQQRANPDLMIYAATKAAQYHMVRTLARQVGQQGVTVNNLAPGLIETDRNTFQLTAEADRESWRQRIPVGVIGQPDDCAGAALLLCSEAGRYITGVDLLVDGGLSL